MEELDARAFRGHRRSLDGGRNPAYDERVLSTHSGQPPGSRRVRSGVETRRWSLPLFLALFESAGRARQPAYHAM
jgi:hypothetical protein